MQNSIIYGGMLLMLPIATAPQAMAQTTHTHLPSPSAAPDTLAYGDQELQEVTVVRRRSGQTRLPGAFNGTLIGRDELFKAACCNLGESFSTNPSVDVNYSDAATGARQIKLLGLSGSYVQMMTEMQPAFRGSAAPFALGYVPGTWMKSIQVSKGAASVKHGYESITGQINVEYLKPEDEQGMTVNLYGDTDSKMEVNAEGNIHLDDRWSTELLTHYENRWGTHDGNEDSFADMPNTRQVNVGSRWLYKGDKYILHAGLTALDEHRTSGQTLHHLSPEMQQLMASEQLYHIDIRSRRYEGYMKHAFFIDPERGANIALIANAAMQEHDAGYGLRRYGVNEKNLQSQLMYETNIASAHNLSVGLSLNYDRLGQRYRLAHDAQQPESRLTEREVVPGVYAQYTYTLSTRFTAMAGVRLDHSSLYGTFATPRVHLKWQPSDIVGFRASAGKGYRAVHALADHHYLLAGSRAVIMGDVAQEEAWNFGISSQLNIPIANKTLKVNAEYYYTRFLSQTTVDFDSDVHAVTIASSDALAYSHVAQVDASYEIARGLTLTAAYRRNYVRENYDGRRLEKPLQSRWKGLFNAGYKTPTGLWQVDATLSLNGGGRMPTAYTLSDGTQSWASSFGSYATVNAQVTRWYRHFSLYIGGENLTGFKQKHPIVDGMNPWGSQFDPLMIYGPIHGAMGYVGIRFNVGRL